MKQQGVLSLVKYNENGVGIWVLITEGGLDAVSIPSQRAPFVFILIQIKLLENMELLYLGLVDKI